MNQTESGQALGLTEPRNSCCDHKQKFSLESKYIQVVMNCRPLCNGVLPKRDDTRQKMCGCTFVITSAVSSLSAVSYSTESHGASARTTGRMPYWLKPQGRESRMVHWVWMQPHCRNNITHMKNQWNLQYYWSLCCAGSIKIILGGSPCNVLAYRSFSIIVKPIAYINKWNCIFEFYKSDECQTQSHNHYYFKQALSNENRLRWFKSDRWWCSAPYE